MKQLKQRNRVFLSMAFALAALSAGHAQAALWDSNYTECVASRIKPESTAMHARAVRDLCEKKFPPAVTKRVYWNVMVGDQLNYSSTDKRKDRSAETFVDIHLGDRKVCRAWYEPSQAHNREYRDTVFTFSRDIACYQ